MPYEVRKTGRADKPYCVYKEAGGPALGCHPSRGQAERQISAILISEHAQKSLKAEAGFVYLSLANDPSVIEVMRDMQAVMPDPDIEWQPIPTLHITLAYMPEVTDEQFLTLARRVQLSEPVNIELAAINVFENPGERALNIQAAVDVKLRDLQAELYRMIADAGIAISNYSIPENWQPHITLAYLPDGIVPPDIPLPVGTQADKIIFGRDDYQSQAEVTATAFKSFDRPLRLALMITSNAYKDRTQEIVKQKALEDWAAAAWEGDQLAVANPLLFWHDGDPIGDIVYVATEGAFLLEVAQERPDAMVNLMPPGSPPVIASIKGIWDAFEEMDTEWGASHEFLYLKEDGKDGVYDQIVKTESTVLPRDWAANAYTLFTVL